MNPIPATIPATLVSGASGAAKQAFVRALINTRPDGEHWAVLDNDDSHLTGLQQARLSMTGINGCACCTGQLALQTGIVQLLRRSHAQRLIIVASAAAEPAPLQHALQQGYLANAIRIDQRFFAGAAADLTPDLPAARLLRHQQLQAADIAVAADATQAAALRTAAAAAGITAPPVMTSAAALRAAAPQSAAAGH